MNMNHYYSEKKIFWIQNRQNADNVNSIQPIVSALLAFCFDPNLCCKTTNNICMVDETVHPSNVISDD
jgi:hypothetical protein